MRPDVVHAHGVDVGYAVGRVAQARGIPSVLTCHGVWFPSLGRRSVRGGIEVRLIRSSGFREITAVDAASASALQSVTSARIRLVPNGVELEEFAGPQSRADQFRFLFAGRHEQHKGLDVLLAATARLRESVPDPFVVEIAGEGSLTGELQRRARDLGLDGVVRFRGPLNRSDLVAAFRSADAFVLPSRSEGFPLVILEAWAARLPVIATSVGGIPHVCTPDNTHLVPPENVTALAEAMAAFVRGAEERVRISERGYALARHRYAWDAIAREYRAIYASVR